MGLRPASLIAFLMCAVGCGPGAIEYSSTQQASTYSCSGTMVQGVDVSSYQGTIDWMKVAGAGYGFAIPKATEGLTLQDSEFMSYWPAIKSAGILRSAYHFFHPMDDGAQQADGFLCTVLGESLGCALPATFAWPGDFPPVLDWEEVDDNVSATTTLQVAHAFIDEIKSRTGAETIIYSSPRYLGEFGDLSSFAASPFWEANWTNSTSSCPESFSLWSTWTFWQWSATGTVPGIAGADGMDLDVFNGTLAQLQALGGGGTTDAGSVMVDAGGNQQDAGTAPSIDAGETDAHPPGCGCGSSSDEVIAMAGLLFASLRRRAASRPSSR